MGAKTAIKRVVLRPGMKARTVIFGDARGIKVNLDLSRGHLRYWLGLYEIEITRHTRRLTWPGAKSFDVGAHQAYDALLLAKLTGAPVASFECEAPSLDLMRRNLALNPRLAPLVTVIGGMVGVDFTLDDWAAMNFVPDFVKIDIDGGEANALRGATHLLREYAPGMIVETHSYALEQDCGRQLIEHGYKVRIINTRQIWPEMRHGEMNRWLVASRHNNVTAIGPRRK